jgi:ADP-ribose pyrophosphatase YjhB (NUDIX family)
MAISANDPELGGWRNLGEEPIVETPWFRLRRARVELPGPGGRQLDHYLIRLPVLTMTAMVDAQDQVLLVLRHRFIPDNRGWELPSGIAELGADPADLAAIASRQALAETGWEAVGPKPMLTLQQNAGLTDSAVHIFITRQAVQHGPPEADFEAERIEWMPLAEVPALIATGAVKDASTATALLWLRGRPER